MSILAFPPLDISILFRSHSPCADYVNRWWNWVEEYVNDMIHRFLQTRAKIGCEDMWVIGFGISREYVDRRICEMMTFVRTAKFASSSDFLAVFLLPLAMCTIRDAYTFFSLSILNSSFLVYQRSGCLKSRTFFRCSVCQLFERNSEPWQHETCQV